MPSSSVSDWTSSFSSKKELDKTDQMLSKIKESGSVSIDLLKPITKNKKLSISDQSRNTYF